MEALADAVSARVMPQVNSAIVRSKRALPEEIEARCVGSVVLLLDKRGGVGVGCAIFLSATTAVTCHHNVAGFEGRDIHGVLDDGTRLVLRVQQAEDDEKALDICALVVHGPDPRTEKLFVELSESVPRRGESAVVLSFQIGIHEDLDDSFAVSVGFVVSSVVKVSKHHLLLHSATFRGDSGAAVVLSDGKLVAMNIAGVNAAKERLREREDAEEDEAVKARLVAVEQSVDSLVADLAQGSVAVRAAAFKHLVHVA